MNRKNIKKSNIKRNLSAVDSFIVDLRPSGQKKLSESQKPVNIAFINWQKFKRIFYNKNHLYWWFLLFLYFNYSAVTTAPFGTTSYHVTPGFSLISAPVLS